MEKIRNHKETIQETLYNKDFYTSNEKWDKEYPKARIKCDYVTYEWEYLDKDEKYQKYSWDKVSLKIYKLTSFEGNVEIAKKAYVSKDWTAYTKNDVKELTMSVDEFKDFVNSVDLDFSVVAE